MQVTETLVEGLKREFRVVVPVTDLDTRLQERLAAMKAQVRIAGFRPGKVPVSHLKRVYGRAVMAEAIEAIVQEMNAKIVSDNGFRLAMEPRVTLPQENSEIEGVVAGEADLAYTVAMEIVPKIELANFKGVKLERPVFVAAPQEVDEGLARIAADNRPFVRMEGDAAAAMGDRVTISFVGKIEGKPFEGGSGEDVAIQIGSNTFIPGFEDQLVGIKTGDARVVSVTFPETYGAAPLAGKAAEFDVTAKSIETPTEVAIDDAFAKSLGVESIEKLREAVGDRIQRDYNALSRQRLKRQLLDQLDELHKFAVPPTLVEEEFKSVWNAMEAELKERSGSFEAEGTTEEAARADYRKISERRVRLGLVLAEIGERNDIKVTEQEVSRALVEQARQMPGREQQIWDFYRKNPQALARLRAPLFEEKVVDFIVELADVTEIPVTREQLMNEDEAGNAVP
ncbi:MAG: trigger factor [Proteobacteria bacterium]|nr:trigger factor [Pseudomonadota bacterium]